MLPRPASVILVVFALVACGGTPQTAVQSTDMPVAGVATDAPQPPITPEAAVPTVGEAVQPDASGYEVNVTKNGTELAAYKQVGARSASASFDGDLVQIILASPDNQHVLTIDIQAAQAGTYPLAPQYDAPKAGQARLNFLTAAPPALIPAVGEVTLSEFTEQFCSGSFTGTGTDIKGDTFSIEGNFSKLVVATEVSLAPQ